MNRQAIRLLLIALIINTTLLTAQSRKEIRDMFYETESWLLFEEYKDALPLYLNLSKINPENYNYKYRIGLCYLNIPGEKEKALPYLQDAVMHINPDYRKGRFSETEAPYDALFYLGTAYRISNELDKAIETYRTFYDGMYYETYDSTVVMQQIEACKNAKSLMTTPLYLKLKNQGEYINENRSDVSPVVSADEKTIVFTRELPFYEGLFYSRKNDGEWGPALQIQAELLIDDGYTSSLSPDGNELYIYKDDGYDGNIYVSHFNNGRWSPAARLNENINTKYWESHACISPDGQKLYFTSNRKGTYGGLDIYVSEKDSVGEWGPAVNLGPAINTPFNEETPFINNSGKVLFFSSRGHFNMGGHDIFYSVNKDGEWSSPVNMGYPLNTTDDDLFYSPVSEGHIAYMSVFDPDGFGMQDIMRVEVFTDDYPRKFHVRGMVQLKDLLSQFTDSVSIKALDKSTLEIMVAVYSDPRTGLFEFKIPHGEYKLIYESEGSETIKKDLYLPLDHTEDSIILATEQLKKTDHIAEISFTAGAGSVSYKPGDTVRIDLKVEPRSLLSVEQWRNDSLTKTKEFFINDPVFIYDTEALTGKNILRFTIKDRFNNITIKDYHFLVSEPFETEPLIIVTDIDELSADEMLAQQEQPDSLKTARDEETKIDRMGQVISEITTSDENKQIRDAIQKTNEKQIKNAGEWLESLYSVAIEDGAEKDILTKLIAAMSADSDDNAEDYIERLMEFAGPRLKEALKNFDSDELKFEKPEEIIEYLLNNSDRLGYARNDVFEAFSKLINATDKSAEEILAYLKIKEGLRLWGIWILLGGVVITLIFFWFRKNKKEND
ncbi:MAG TPA: hypothetical protein DEQ09_12885 [Bacteroidales bacterium]|nr:hypothetical protein [Bacteroidales bacterium]